MSGRVWRLPSGNLCSFLYETATIQARTRGRVQHHKRTFSSWTSNSQRVRASRPATQDESRNKKPEATQSKPLKADFNPLNNARILSSAERKAFENLMGVTKEPNSRTERSSSSASVTSDVYDLNPERILSLFHHAPKKVKGQVENAEARGRGYTNPLKFITALSQSYQKAIEVSEVPEHALWQVFQDLVLPLCILTDQRYIQRMHREVDRKLLLLGHLDLDAASASPREETADYESLTGDTTASSNNDQRRVVMTPQLREILEDLDRSYKLPQLRSTLFPAAIVLTLRTFVFHAPSSPYIAAILPTLRRHLPAASHSEDDQAATDFTTKQTKSVQEEVLNHAHIYNILLIVQRDMYSDVKSMIAVLSDMYARNIRPNDDTLSILRGLVGQDGTRSSSEMQAQEGLEEWWSRRAQVSGMNRVSNWVSDIEESRSRRGRKPARSLA